MFSDCRSKRVIFLAHCILNQNAISDGTAGYPAAHADVVRAILDAQVGIVQMPCPELCCLGLDRGDPQGADRPVVVENTRIREALDRPDAREQLDRLVDHVMLQIREYLRHGFQIAGIVGVNRSPSCGVDTTSDHDREVAGQGVFLAKLRAALAADGISLPVIGIKCTPEALDAVRALLRA